MRWAWLNLPIQFLLKLFAELIPASVAHPTEGLHQNLALAAAGVQTSAGTVLGVMDLGARGAKVAAGGLGLDPSEEVFGDDQGHIVATLSAENSHRRSPLTATLMSPLTVSASMRPRRTMSPLTLLTSTSGLLTVAFEVAVDSAAVEFTRGCGGAFPYSHTQPAPSGAGWSKTRTLSDQKS